MNDFTMAMRGIHVVVLPSLAIGRVLVSIVLFLRQKCPMAPAITRSKDEDDTMGKNAFTMVLRGVRWTHEFNTKMNLRTHLRQFFGCQKILPPLTKLLPEPSIIDRRSYDGLRCTREWLEMHSRMTRCFHD